MKKPDKRNGAIIFPQKAGNKTAFLETVKETKTIPLQAIFQRVERGGKKDCQALSLPKIYCSVMQGTEQIFLYL